MIKLLLVRNELNDVNTDLYAKSIKRMVKEKYSESIEIEEVTCSNRNQLIRIADEDNLLGTKILLLQPTNIIMPNHLRFMDAENNQVSDVVSEMIDSNDEVSKRDSRILIIGKGIVGKAIFNNLCIGKGYFVSMCGSIPELHWTDTCGYDVIINCINANVTSKVVDVESDAFIYDVSGNFEARHIYYEKITMRTIGKATTQRMLEGVLNDG